jgi:tryptophan halogenase
MSAALRDLVIVGRDAPLWLAACVMQQALGPAGVTITAIELPSARAAGRRVRDAARARAPAHALAHRRVAPHGRDPRRSSTLGRNFTDSSRALRQPFFHPHGSVGTRIDRKEFLRGWTLARRMGLSQPFEDFSLTAVAAQAQPHAAARRGHRRIRIHRLRLSPAGHPVWRLAQEARPATRRAQPRHARAGSTC